MPCRNLNGFYYSIETLIFNENITDSPAESFPKKVQSKRMNVFLHISFYPKESTVFRFNYNCFFLRNCNRLQLHLFRNLIMQSPNTGWLAANRHLTHCSQMNKIIKPMRQMKTFLHLTLPSKCYQMLHRGRVEA